VTQQVEQAQATEKSPEQQAQAAAESNAAFEAGFNKERGLPVEKPEAKPVEPKAEAKAEVTPAKAEEAKAVEDPWKDVHPTVKAQFDSVNSKLQLIDKQGDRLRNMEGVLGGINTQLKTALAAAKTVKEAGGEAPTQAQVKEAMLSPEDLAEMKEDFPKFAAAIEKMEKRIAAAEAAKPPVDAEALRAEIRGEFQEKLTKAEQRAEESRQLAAIDAKHPDWEKAITTPEFDAWWKQQPQEIQALHASRQASDVIRVLDAYEVHAKKVKADAEAKAKQEQRLKGAMTPKGVPASPSTLNDDESPRKLIPIQE
jgi:hypothetical protein